MKEKSETGRKKMQPDKPRLRVSADPASPVCTGYFGVAVAAYLNWCHRRKQNLPDDAFADWIAAESKMNLVN